MNNKLEINPYDSEACQKIVEEKYLDKIQAKFGTSAFLTYDKIFALNINDLEDWDKYYKSRGAIPNPRCMISMKFYSCTLYYYIDAMLGVNPKTVIDIGCGENMFKDIVPGLIGCDPNGTFADFTESFGYSGEFSADHKHEYDAAMSICSIHFISLKEFRDQIMRFANVIKPGGRGLLVMNGIRMVERTSDEDLIELFGTTEPTPLMVEEYIDGELKKMSLNFLIVDNIVSQKYDEWMDGNIRLVFDV